MKAGIRDLSLLFTTKTANLIFALGLQSCLAWFLGASDRGSYSVCLVYSSVLSVIFIIGCDYASVYFVASKKFTLSEGIFYSLIYGIICSIIAIIIGLIGLEISIDIFKKAAKSDFQFGLLLIPTTLFASIFTRLFASIKQFYLYSMASFINSMFSLIYTVIFVYLLKYGVKGAILGNIGGSLTSIIFCVFVYKYRYKVSFVKIQFKKIKEMFLYGIKYYFGKVSNRVNHESGTLILGLLASPAEIGIFAVASRLTEKILIIPDTLTEVLIPRIAAEEGGRKNLVSQCARLTGLFTLGSVILIIICAKYFVLVVFSSEFLPAVPLIQIISIGVILRSFSKVFVPFLLGTNHPEVASLSVFIAGVANLLTMYFLYPKIGLMGAAIGVVVGYITSSLILTIGFSKYSNTKIRNIISYTSRDFSGLQSFIKVSKIK